MTISLKCKLSTCITRNSGFRRDSHAHTHAAVQIRVRFVSVGSRHRIVCNRPIPNTLTHVRRPSVTSARRAPPDRMQKIDCRAEPSRTMHFQHPALRRLVSLGHQRLEPAVRRLAYDHPQKRPQANADLWRVLSVLTLIPMFAAHAYSGQVHREDSSEQRKHCRPEYIQYEYMQRRTKPFPWGDGNHTLFHSPTRNPIPGVGYEEHLGRSCEDLMAGVLTDVVCPPGTDKWDTIAHSQTAAQSNRLGGKYREDRSSCQ